MTEIKLSPGQEAAFDIIMRWFWGPDQCFALAGYAGAGKTTLAKIIAESVGEDVLFCAFTGKAANVLRDKGCDNAMTLHAALYTPIEVDEAAIKEIEASIEGAAIIGDNALIDKLTKQLAELRLKQQKPRFSLNEDGYFGQARLCIVDEYSMLNNELIRDMVKVGKKILYLGDPEQLPPVEGECSIKPDLFIDEIHRQALDSPIIRYATMVRMGERLEYVDEPGFVFQPKSKVSSEEYMKAEQIIVGRNATRWAWNRRMRERRGIVYPKDGLVPMPAPGEKLICLKNNQKLDLYNGMICFAADYRPAAENRIILDIERESGHRTNGLNVWPGDFEGKKATYSEQMKRLERFDFAYAITAHKSQGSEFDSVLIYNEPIGQTTEDRRRWLYTSLTRARNKVTLVDPR